MVKVYVSKRIDSGTPSPVKLVNYSTYVTSIVYNCSNAGTGWTLKIVDRSSPPKVLIGPFPVVVPTDGKPSAIFELQNDRVAMRGGVDAVLSGTAGSLDLWLTGNRTEEIA
jgi:hypothetical protein